MELIYMCLPRIKTHPIDRSYRPQRAVRSRPASACPACTHRCPGIQWRIPGRHIFSRSPSVEAPASRRISITYSRLLSFGDAEIKVVATKETSLSQPPHRRTTMRRIFLSGWETFTVPPGDMVSVHACVNYLQHRSCASVNLLYPHCFIFPDSRSAFFLHLASQCLFQK